MRDCFVYLGCRTNFTFEILGHVPYRITPDRGMVHTDGGELIIQQDFFALRGAQKLYLLARHLLSIALCHPQRLARAEDRPMLAFMQNVLLSEVLATQEWMQETGATRHILSHASVAEIHAYSSELLCDRLVRSQLDLLPELPLHDLLHESSQPSGPYSVTVDEQSCALWKRRLQAAASRNWTRWGGNQILPKLAAEVARITDIEIPDDSKQNTADITQLLNADAHAQINLVPANPTELVPLAYQVAESLTNADDVSKAMQLFENIAALSSYHGIYQFFAVEQVFERAHKLRCSMKLMQDPHFLVFKEKLSRCFDSMT